MKNLLIAGLLVAAALAGIFSWQQKKQVTQVQTQLAEAQRQLADKAQADAKVAFAEKRAQALQTALVDTSKYAAEKTELAEQLRQKQAAAKTNDNEANPLAAMFKDPKMKEMIKASQKTFMGPMIDKQYKTFFQQMNCSPEQAATLKDLLQKKMLAGADAGMSLMDTSLDAKQREELTKQMKQETDDYDAQIKQFLGDDNYKAFQAYEKTTADRMSAGMFSEQLASGTTPLSAEQQEQLVQAMSEERNGFKWTTDYSNKTPPDGDFTTMFSEEKLDRFTQEQEKLNQQILARAQSILTPEQLTAFQEFQASQQAMQTAGMKMAAKMFAPKQ